MKGVWSEKIIDHKNNIRNDDRWCNLREGTVSENNCNRSVTQSYIGLKGVHKMPSGRYGARIGRGSKTWLGVFDTAEAAHNAYIRAAQSQYGDFANGGAL
jgi:hypothetical protein